MRRIVFFILLASVGLVGSEGATPYKSGMLLPPQADKIYEKECTLCHGKDGKQTSYAGLTKSAYGKIAGMDTAELAKILKEYRGGIKSKDYGPLNKYGYGALMKSVMKDLSWEEIDALAVYVNGLK